MDKSDKERMFEEWYGSLPEAQKNPASKAGKKQGYLAGLKAQQPSLTVEQVKEAFSKHYILEGYGSVSDKFFKELGQALKTLPKTEAGEVNQLFNCPKGGNPQQKGTEDE